MAYKVGTLLQKINSPEDLKNLSAEELVPLSKELREYIIEVVSENGGHLGASLGVVELTIALHYVYNTPKDLLVWDVGHQAYGHKILTGRRDLFPSARKLNGISGFPSRDESKYDAFGVGHSSTSISAVLGMAVANKLQKDDRAHIAVIGDGAMTAGLAFEGLNHAGSENADVLIILNDNCMSIDPNVGALKEYLNQVTSKASLFKTDNHSQVNEAISGTFLEKNNLFEALGFNFFGPVDGHDLNQLINTLNEIKKIKGPKLLHVVTQKGKGYLPAEKGSPTTWHAPGLFDKNTGKILKPESTEKKGKKFQDIFGETIVELAGKNDKIVGITPAMPTGSSMNMMMDAFPDRTFDVGIAEQHAVTFSAGLATQGLIPFCNIYSSFMQRAYDQVIHDVALQNLPVVFCLDRAGLVGADGATHHGSFDLSYMQCIPNLIIASPMHENELRDLMYTAQLGLSKPMVIRYPRGRAKLNEVTKPMEKIEVGSVDVIQKEGKVAILSTGPWGEDIIQLHAEEGDFAHYNFRFIKPLDENKLHEIFKRHPKIITYEDNAYIGGLGSAIAQFKAKHNYSNQLVTLALPDQFIEHGSQSELRKQVGLDIDTLKKHLK